MSLLGREHVNLEVKEITQSFNSSKFWGKGNYSSGESLGSTGVKGSFKTKKQRMECLY